MRWTLLVSRHATVPAGILAATHHLLDPMEALPVKTERLFKQHLVLHRPLIREGGEVWEISEWLLNVVLMPEEHAESLRITEEEHPYVSQSLTTETFDLGVLAAYLLNIVSMLFFRDCNVLVHCECVTDTNCIIHNINIKVFFTIIIKNVYDKKGSCKNLHFESTIVWYGDQTNMPPLSLSLYFVEATKYKHKKYVLHVKKYH